jgi:hypothetical protein
MRPSGSLGPYVRLLGIEAGKCPSVTIPRVLIGGRKSVESTYRFNDHGCDLAFRLAFIVVTRLMKALTSVILSRSE